jgi:membrane protease YdiL (CAAX protease family)
VPGRRPPRPMRDVGRRGPSHAGIAIVNPDPWTPTLAMTLPVRLNPLVWLLLMRAFAVTGFLVMCAVVAFRAVRGRPLLPYQPRRPVPWQAIDLLLIMVVYIAAVGAASHLVEARLGPEFTEPPILYDVGKADATHVIAKLLRTGNVWVSLLAGLSAVVVAPIVEEFLFRLLLQGWLEAGQRRLKRKMPTLRRLVPGGVGPVVLASLLFAMIHFHVARPMRHPYFEIGLILGGSVASLLTMAFALGLLGLRVRATAEDLGWVPGKLLADVKLGVLAFVGLAAPIYFTHYLWTTLLPSYIAPDPFPLFLLALALGTLYYRTHRIVPAIVLHMSLNMTSLAMAWLTAGG